MTLYISGFSLGTLRIYAYIKCKLHLVNNLKANILIDNNILCIKSFLINFFNNFTYIQNYNVNIVISAKYYSKFLNYKFLVNAAIFILLQSKASVLFFK